MRHFYLCILAIAGLLIAAPQLWPQTSTPEEVRTYAVSIDSGARSNPGATHAVAFSEVVEVPEARWVSVIFEEVHLEGDSFIAVESHLTGERLVLDRAAIAEWQNAAPPLSGERVTVSLHAGPYTANNRVSVRQALGGHTMARQEAAAPAAKKGQERTSVCSTNDRRSPFARNAIGRLIRLTPGFIHFCTATIALCPGSCGKYAILVTAGHCFRTQACATGGPTQPFTSLFVEFNVPPSNAADCTHNWADPVKKRFAVRIADVIARNCADGDDWAVFLVEKNTATPRKTALEEQRDYFNLQFAGASNRLATVAGYGVDGGQDGPPAIDRHCQPCVNNGTNAERNVVLQRDHTYITSVVGDVVSHQIHTCGGDSGGPIYVTGNAGQEILAIHTTGTAGPVCSAGRTVNAGTNMTNAALRTAITEMCARAKTLAGL